MGYMSSDSSGKTYAQRKRESYDYRGNYIKHNPGICNGLYFCSQCFKPLSRTSMEVDHIFPVSKWFAPNRVINCVAICSSCNKKKSDKITWKMSVKGILCKILEEIYILFQRLITWSIKLAIVVFIASLRIMWRPMITDRSIVQKGIIGVTYLYVLFLII